MSTQITGRAVYWSKKYEVVVNKLVGKDRDDKRRAFETNMEVLVFAAFLGVKYKKMEHVGADRLEVPTDVFNNRKMFQALFLLPLLHKKDANILRQDKDSELVSIFQDYANGGLSIIQSWLEAEPTDIYGDMILMKKILEEINLTANSDIFTDNTKPIIF